MRNLNKGGYNADYMIHNMIYLIQFILLEYL